MEKKILFISPTFFGYEIDIIKKMMVLGNDVTFFDERVSSRKFLKFLVKINPLLIYPLALVRYRRILNSIKNDNFDNIIVIKAQSTPSYFLRKIYKKYNNSSLIVLYLWDSIKNIKGIKKKFKYFHRIYTFDRNDAAKNIRMKFLPLFYSDTFKNNDVNNQNYNYDLMFVGTVHSDRFKLLEKIKFAALENGLKVKFVYYFPSKIIFYLLKITKLKFANADQNNFIFSSIDKTEIRQLIHMSKGIVDINHHKQFGLTMRTIESIGMNKKLFTTNFDIVNYDFYNDENIYLLNRNICNLNFDILKTPYRKIDFNVYNKYGLYFWLNQLLNE